MGKKYTVTIERTRSQFAEFKTFSYRIFDNTKKKATAVGYCNYPFESFEKALKDAVSRIKNKNFQNP